MWFVDLKLSSWAGRIWLSASMLACGLAGACGDQGSPSRSTADAQARQPDSGTAREVDLPSVRLAPAFPKLSFNRPVFITHAGDGSGRLFVVEQTGRIIALSDNTDQANAEVFLDVSSKIRMQHNEEGLLSLVFDPKFKDNGQFYIYYSLSNPKRNRIARYSVSEHDPRRADPDSEQVILDVEQPYGNHNGSTLLFGPDGYLYASYGDGGWAGDPHNNGQNLQTLLGSIIRIDVHRTEEGRPYAIPPENPFAGAGAGGARPEIWAYGLRNVWRMSFDRETGDLWAGDVGQNDWEEIDLIVKGGNYGWNIREGKHPYPRRRQSTPPAASGASQLIDPIVEYSHREGLSVTGGYVYRGKRFPQLQGVYLYDDYASGKIWGLRYANGTVQANAQIGGHGSGSERKFITSFGEDADGELYVCAFDRLDGRTGRVYRVVVN